MQRRKCSRDVWPWKGPLCFLRMRNNIRDMVLKRTFRLFLREQQVRDRWFWDGPLMTKSDIRDSTKLLIHHQLLSKGPSKEHQRTTSNLGIQVVPSSSLSSRNRFRFSFLMPDLCRICTSCVHMPSRFGHMIFEMKVGITVAWLVKGG